MVYTLAKALGISPLEVYKMPSDLVKDMLVIHCEVEKIKAEEIEKEMNKQKPRGIWYANY